MNCGQIFLEQPNVEIAICFGHTGINHTKNRLKKGNFRCHIILIYLMDLKIQTMKKIDNLITAYHKSIRKLSNLKRANRNHRRQGILSINIRRIYEKLMAFKASLKRTVVAAGVVSGAMLLAPQAANAQTFGPKQENPFGLSNAGDSFINPTLADLDDDGDLDLLVGANSGGFLYYKNTGTSNAPDFTFAEAAPFGLTAVETGFSTTSLEDLDNDADLDLLSGGINGDFNYYENIGTASAPDFASLQVNPFGLVIGTIFNDPNFIDLDQDGDFDIMSENELTGDFIYLKNIGSATLPEFEAPDIDPFGLSGPESGFLLVLVTFADLDNDGDADLMTSGYTNDFTYYENIGSSSFPEFGTTQTNPFDITAGFSTYNCSTFGDLDGDGDLDFFYGDGSGNFYYQENIDQLSGINEFDNNNPITIYPNPSNGLFTIECAQKGSYLLQNELGQTVKTIQVNALNNFKVNINNLGAGIYFIVDVANLENKRKVVVTK